MRLELVQAITLGQLISSLSFPLPAKAAAE